MDKVTLAKQTATIADIFSLDKFEEALVGYKNNLLIVKDSNQLAAYILQEFSDVCMLYLTIGEDLKEKTVNSTDHTQNIEVFLVNYFIPEHLKNVIILHRDVLLELTKASVLSKEDNALEVQLPIHFNESKTILETAVTALINLISNEKTLLLKDQKAQKKIRKSLLLHDNPWTIYADQYRTLVQQLKDIHIAENLLSNTLDKFISLKKVVTSIEKNHKKIHTKLNDTLDQLLGKVNDEVSISELTSFIDSELALFETLGNQQTNVTDELTFYINTLDSIEIPVATDDGILSTHEIQLKKVVQKWFDYQIVPNFMDLITLENNLKNKNNVAVINLKNSILLSKNNEKVDLLEIFSSSIQKLKESLIVSGKNSEQIIAKMLKEIDEELLVKKIFNSDSFLEVTFNSSSLNRTKNTFFKNIEESYRQVRYYLNSQYKKTALQESFTKLELSLKCIAHRMFKEENEHYDTLFLAKNFFGDLFLVPRILQEEKFKEAINQWNSGFNKSVLVHGDRLSGKSSFIDYTSKEYFGKDIVILKPNSIATIDGRKFKTTYDLKEALQYLKNNNSKITRPVILIDDLELWRDKTHILLDNVRALIEFIETESDDAFIVATTTNAMKYHLDNTISFSEAFSTSIDISKTYKEEIFEAIMLRHGAGQRVLISESNELISIKKIQSSVYKLCKQYQNNLGDVLQAWTYSTFVREDNKVMFKEEEHEFMDFFSQNELIILKQVMLFRYVSEYGLKHVMASGFEANFNSSLKRLINSKILLRELQGNLYINPVVLNDVTKVLEQKKYILK